VLGRLSVDGDGAGLGSRDRVVLAALALRPAEVVSTERLADALWGERAPASWNKVVQGCVVRLRKVLGPEAIETVPTGYRLLVPLDEIDAHRFERLLMRGRELMTLGEPERAAYVIRESLALWHGPALVDLERWEPGRVEAGRLEELRLEAEEAGFDASLRAGRHRDVLGDAQALVAAAPLREDRWALLALAQYRSGRQGDALRTLHQARSVLAGELGVDPGPDLLALEHAVLRHDPSLAPAIELPEPSASCPYLGLVPYDVRDADAFFGRDADIAACLRRLAASGVLVVVGPSGCGKSSLVRAGVAASLRRAGRPVVVVTPGSHPMDALTALPTAEPMPVLVVDQAEEAVTLCVDAVERARFLAALVSYAERGALVVALRADRLGEVSVHPAFARMVEHGLYLVNTLHDVDLRAAIEGPAEQAGLLLEPGLVDLLVRDVEGEPGALPLLSHALRKTWERREDRTLTVAGYRETGGIRGAVAQSAEELYASVSPERRIMLRDTLLRLVSPGTAGEPVRGRVPRRLVATDPEREQLIEVLVGARLVTSDDGVVELAHEALARAWPRLRAWLDDDVEGQRILRHLTVAADTWETMGRPDSELYRGVRLAQALEWRDHTSPDITRNERAFLDASDGAHAVASRAAQRTTRKLRTLAYGLAAALVIAMIAGTVAILRSRDADREAARAERVATLAQANRLATLARTLPTRQIDLALLLGAEGVRLLPSVATDGGLEVALARTPPGLEHVLHFDTPSAYASVTADARLVAAPGTDGKVRILDLPTGRPLRTLRGHDSNGAFVTRFSSDAGLLAAGGRDGKVILWRVGTGKRIGPAITPGGTVVYGFFDPTDATQLFTVSDDGTVARWDIRDPRHPEQVGDRFGFPTAPNDVPVATVSPDGRLVAAGGFITQRTAVWDVATQRLLYELPGTPGRFDPDSATLTTSLPDRVVLWDAATGRQDGAPLTGFTSAAPATVFSPDRHLLAAGDLADNTIRVFDLASRMPIGEPLALHGAFAFPSHFLPDGRLVTTGANETAIWRLDARVSPVETVLGGHAGVAVGEFNPSGADVMTVGLDDHRVRAWDATTGAFRGDLLDFRAATGAVVAFSPDGTTAATGGRDGSFSIWDVTTGRRLSRTDTDQAGSIAVAWDPRGSLVATGGADASLTLWDVANATRPVETRRFVARKQLPDLPASELGVYPRFSPRFSPDGRLLAALSPTPPRVTVFDVATGDELHAIQEGVSLRVAFTRDGTTLATAVTEGNNTGKVILWDTTTWKRRATLPLSYPPNALVFFKGGERFATASLTTPQGGSGTTAWVDLWDTATLQPVGERLNLPTPDAFLARANAHGTKIAVGSYDGKVVVVDVDPNSWQRTACRIAGRNLTRAEWAQYLPGRPYHATCTRWPDNH
jgi:WD40 repeat protein/DNA-binding SARP family transcriptional activator